MASIQCLIAVVLHYPGLRCLCLTPFCVSSSLPASSILVFGMLPATHSRISILRSVCFCSLKSVSSEVEVKRCFATFARKSGIRDTKWPQSHALSQMQPAAAGSLFFRRPLPSGKVCRSREGESGACRSNDAGPANDFGKEGLTHQPCSSKRNNPVAVDNVHSAGTFRNASIDLDVSCGCRGAGI